MSIDENSKDYTSGKIRKQIKTPSKRSRDARAKRKDLNTRLAAVLDHPNPTVAKVGELIRLAEYQRERIPPGEFPLVYSLAEDFLSSLQHRSPCQCSIDDLWANLLELIAEIDERILKTLSQSYSAQFEWMVFGHVQRLAADYSARPESIRWVGFLVSKHKPKVRIPVGIRNDGSEVPLPDSHYWEAPAIAFPGQLVRLPNGRVLNCHKTVVLNAELRPDRDALLRTMGDSIRRFRYRPTEQG